MRFVCAIQGYFFCIFLSRFSSFQYWERCLNHMHLLYSNYISYRGKGRARHGYPAQIPGQPRAWGSHFPWPIILLGVLMGRKRQGGAGKPRDGCWKPFPMANVLPRVFVWLVGRYVAEPPSRQVTDVPSCRVAKLLRCRVAEISSH
jgi:hypothetical protein